MTPLSIESRLAAIFKRVVLPAPFSPVIRVVEELPIVNDKSLIILR
jgi:hypothetical protein